MQTTFPILVNFNGEPYQACRLVDLGVPFDVLSALPTEQVKALVLDLVDNVDLFEDVAKTVSVFGPDGKTFWFAGPVTITEYYNARHARLMAEQDEKEAAAEEELAAERHRNITDAYLEEASQ